jgi:hypothetical protein
MNEEHGCTLGVLSNSEGVICYTLENPWLDNRRNVSCIPEGEYECKPYSSAKYHNVWELQNVQDRSKILIHAGNFEEDTRGCILIGRAIADYNGKKMITNSRHTLEKLRDIIGVKNSFTIEVVGL